MGFQPKVSIISAKSTGINTCDTTGDYHATNNPTGYGTPNPAKAAVTAILYAEPVHGNSISSVSGLTEPQRTAYLAGTGAIPGSVALKDGVYDVYAFIGFAGPSTLTANNGTTQFAFTNANTVFLEAVGFSIDAEDPKKIYFIDRTKVLNGSGGYVTENLPVVTGAAITIYYQTKVNALVYDQGEACLLNDIANSDIGCGCSSEQLDELMARYTQYLAMLNKFQVSKDYPGAHKLAVKLQADCDPTCVPCGDSMLGSTSSTACVPPSITTQPVGATVDAGGNTTLSVLATGTATLYYQWKKNGVDLAGRTNSSLTLSNVQAGDAGTYSVVVSNACGSVVSSGAAVALSAGLTPVTITLQPVPVVQAAGTDVVFTIAATGSPTITYQWRKDGVAISGATGTALTLTAVDAGDEGSYDCVVTNPAGSVNSNAATFTLGVTALFGWSNTVPTTLSHINALQADASMIPGGTITADFRSNATPLYLIMAEPSTEPAKTKWYGDVNNNGNIGNPNTDLFGTPVIIGSYRVYVTTYKTFNTTTPIQFRVS